MKLQNMSLIIRLFKLLVLQLRFSNFNSVFNSSYVNIYILILNKKYYKMLNGNLNLDNMNP